MHRLRRFVCAAHAMPPLLLLALSCTPVASAQTPAAAPVAIAVHPVTSWAHADGVSWDLDLLSDDFVAGWRIRFVDVRGPAPLGSLLTFEAGTPGFLVDGGRTRLEPGSLLTALLHLPRGLEHLDLTVSILIEDDAGALSYVDFDLPASATAGLQVTSDVLIQPGPPTVAQQAFQADWSTKASLYSDPDAKAKAYRAAKAKALGGSKKMAVTP